MKKIVFTGPESTGKTETAFKISERMGYCYAPEYAVEYLEQTSGEYNFEDLYKIGIGQLKTEDAIINNCKSDFFICDTDLITIKIWSKVRFNKVDKRLLSMIRNRYYDHYILCYPDIEWEYAKFRENPDDRDYLFKIYKNQLKYYKKNFSILRGSGEERIKNAENIISSL
ncbi:MAG: ATP-binding protein [Saprospiraceae bacterium]